MHFALISHQRLRGQKLFAIMSLLITFAVQFSSTANVANGQDATQNKDDSLMGLKTVAEQTHYTATATGPEVTEFLRGLTEHWTAAELTSIGKTNEGRSLDAVIAMSDNKDALTVLVLGGIHSGECDGKEALLALARDLVSGQHGDFYQALNLILVPNYNADGNERRSLYHRPRQEGPAAGMGIRENAQGFDLNRDFVKLESPEARSLIATIDKYDVDVLIDLHTTNGSLHRYDLTYDIPHNPVIGPQLDSYLRGEFIPAVTSAMSEAGFNTTYYGNFDSEHRKWTTFGHQPRYSTEYMGLRGKIGILSESYSYVSYQRKIEAGYEFTLNVLRSLAKDQAKIAEILASTTAEFVAGQELPINAELTKTADSQLALGFEDEQGRPPRGPYGAAALKSHKPKDYLVELWNSFQPTTQVKIPAAYIVPSQYSWVAQRLMMHGVELSVLNADTQMQVESYEVSELERFPEFQTHRMLKVSVASSSEETLVPAGSIVVSTAQPLGRLITYLLEPHSDDSLAVWNFFDPDLRVGGEYPILRVPSTITAAELTRLDSPPRAEVITLDHLSAPNSTVDYDGRLRRSARWLGDSTEYTVRSGSELYVVNAETGAERRLTELTQIERALTALGLERKDARSVAEAADLTADLKYAIAQHNSDLYLYESDSQTARRVTESEQVKEKLAELSPTREHIAYVANNNLNVVALGNGEIKSLTQDGQPEELLNGILDWVYQEELYGRGNFKAFWWSPDGKRIAYLKLDESPVHHYAVMDSISFRQTLEDTRYPKAGDPLPNVSVWVADVATGKSIEVDLSDLPVNDRLIARVTWSEQGELWLQVTNRVQNRLQLLRVDAEGSATVVLNEESPGWIEIRGEPTFLSDGSFLWLSDLPAGRTHLYHVDSEGKQRRAITGGEWDVADMHGVSEDESQVFVSGNLASPIENHLYSVTLNPDASPGGVPSPKQLTALPGDHSVRFDASCSYFIDTHSAIDRQRRIDVSRASGELLRVIDAPRSDRHQALSVSSPVLTTIPAKDGLPLQAAIMLPPGKTLDSNEKLPVLFFVYGGPQAPTVKNAWAGRNYWWHQMLCQQGIAVVLCDNRAARGRGVKDTWTIRGDMCRVELEDLLAATDWVAKQPWADDQRFGLWGWSYGGYFTSYAMTHCDRFKAGIAGAPVTDWRNYDAIYTERYMDLPQDNPEGYDSSSVVKAARHLSGRLMIIHGERDDNVHMSNTLQLAHALQNAGKTFDLMVYPKNRHGIVDPSQKHHLHKTMTEFFTRHLLEQD